MLYKNDVVMTTILYNIHAHLVDDFDYLLVVVGDTGTGKSMFVLNLLETWYRAILKKPITLDMVDQVNTSYTGWVKKFQELEAYDMNIYDEGATGLDSKQSMSKLSKDLSKLFNVFRCKKFLSVIVLPKFFRLDKYFREDRVRGLVYVDKRGRYKFYTKKGLQYLNAYNEKRTFKSMGVARAIHSNTFPDYKGILLEKYLENKEKGVNAVLQGVIDGLDNKHKPKTIVEAKKEEVKELLSKGFKEVDILKELGISKGTLTRIKANL